MAPKKPTALNVKPAPAKNTKPVAPPAPPKPKGPKGFQPGHKKMGGKKKGTPNKKTLYKQTVEKLEARAKQAKAAGVNEDGQEVDEHGRVLGPIYGMTPLEFMIGVMHDRTMPTGFRASAAKDAAPYIHPKLATVEVKQRSVVVNADAGSVKKGAKNLSAEDLAKLYKDILDND